jgi:hypothetical protein
MLTGILAKGISSACDEEEEEEVMMSYALPGGELH